MLPLFDFDLDVGCFSYVVKDDLHFVKAHNVLLFLVVWLSAGRDHGIELADHDGALSNRPEIAPRQFIDKMAESIVVFFLALDLLDGQLQLALHFPHKEIVNHDVIGRLIQLVLDPHQLELTMHRVAAVKQIHSFEHVDEDRLGALQLRSHKIADSEDHQVDVLETTLGHDLLA
jgi:hypothetical protein